MTEVTTEIAKVDPEMAALFLEQNKVNRPLREGQVNGNAEAMAAGLWQLNGESIKFNQDGDLVDGQHRLSAIVKSGATIETLIVRGLPSEAQPTMDAGLKRSLADQLALAGTTGTAQTAAVVRLSKAWADGQRATRGKPPAYNNAVLLKHMEEHPGLVEAAALGRLYASRMPAGLGGAAVGFACYLLSRIDSNEMDAFMESLADGVGLEEGDAVLALRNRLIRTRFKSAPMYQVGLLFRAWNARRENRSVTKFVLEGREGSLDRITEPR